MKPLIPRDQDLHPEQFQYLPQVTSCLIHRTHSKELQGKD